MGLVRVFFTASVHRRQPLFLDSRLASLCVSHLLRLAVACDVAVTAYCLMPDHAHVLLEGRGRHSSVLECFVRWQKTTSSMVRARSGLRLWQDTFVDRVLRSDEASVAVAAYVLANPVRAHLAQTLGEYGLAGSTVFTTAELTAALQDG